jgi:hypothetical protein
MGLAGRPGERRTPIMRATALALAASFSLLLYPGGFGFVFIVMVLMNLLHDRANADR